MVNSANLRRSGGVWGAGGGRRHGDAASEGRGHQIRAALRPVEVDLELPGRIFQIRRTTSTSNLGRPVSSTSGRHYDDQAIGQLDLDLTEIRSHRRIDDGPAVELQQRLGNASKIMQRDVGHSDLS